METTDTPRSLSPVSMADGQDLPSVRGLQVEPFATMVANAVDFLETLLHQFKCC